MAFGCQMQIILDDFREVQLKPFTRDDVSQVVDGMQRYSNLKWLSTRNAQTLETEQAWYDRVSTSTDDVLFGVHVHGRLVGSFGLHGVADQRGTAGAVMFSSQHQEAGIGTAVTRAGLFYAVRVLDMAAIDSAVLSSNERSRRMQQSAGFVVTGRKLRCHVVDGRICDELSLIWINPERYCWDNFWRGSAPGDKFASARDKARHALAWAETHVTFL